MSLAPTLDLPVTIRRPGQVSSLPFPPRAIPGDTRRVAAPGASKDRPHLRLVDDFGPAHTALLDLPDPAAWAARISVGLYEAAIGARPTTQVMRWLSPEVFDSVVRRSSRGVRRGPATRRPVRLRRVRICRSGNDTAGIVEVSVVLDDHRRVRAMAMRLEGLDGRWLVTALEIG